MVILFRILFLFLALSFATSAPSPDYIKIAQCQSSCLGELGFARFGHEASALCQETSGNCAVCWSACVGLCTSPDLWRHMCKDSNNCGKGCEIACQRKFTVETSGPWDFPQPASVEVIHSQLAFVSWQAPLRILDSNLETEFMPIVYVLLHKGTSTKEGRNTWKLLLTTTALATNIHVQQPSELKLVAVGHGGVLATTYPLSDTWGPDEKYFVVEAAASSKPVETSIRDLSTISTSAATSIDHIQTSPKPVQTSPRPADTSLLESPILWILVGISLLTLTVSTVTIMIVRKRRNERTDPPVVLRPAMSPLVSPPCPMHTPDITQTSLGWV